MSDINILEISYFVIALVAMVMNSGFAFVIMRTNHLRQPLFIFMACFAIFDVILCSSLLVILFNVREWTLGTVCCRLVRFSSEFGADTKPILMILVVFAYVFKENVCTKTLQIIIGAAILMSLLEVVPFNESFQVVNHDIGSLEFTVNSCVPTNVSKLFIIVELFLKFLLPFGSCIFILIMYTVGDFHKNITQQFEAKMFSTVLLWYTILSSPIVVFAFLSDINLLQHPFEFDQLLIYSGMKMVFECMSMIGPIYKPIYFYFKCNEIRNEIDVRVKLLFDRDEHQSERLVENMI